MSREVEPELLAARAGMHRRRVRFAGLDLLLDGSGALILPDFGTLIVSDLHLEKGSAARRRYVPPLDSRDTLHRLARVLEVHRPRRVICLGDSFHDTNGAARMAAADRALLDHLCASVESWVWVNGNHDGDAPCLGKGERSDAVEIHGIRLAHQPEAGLDCPQIVGHFHPKAAISTGHYRVSAPCFSLCDRLLVMPAFGAYTGGLNCAGPTIRSLHPGRQRVFMLYAGKVWRVA